MLVQAQHLDMENNLETLIKLSGLTKRQVAEQKGVTPETLSRHIHGKIRLSLDDAAEYAEILNTTTHNVLFVTPAIPIIGRGHIYGSELSNNVLTVRKVDLKGIGKAYYPTLVSTDTAVIYWTVAKEYDGPWRTWNKVWQMVKMPILSDPIPDYCLSQLCVCKLTETLEMRQGPTNFITGILYPEPRNKYTVDINGHYPGDKIKRSLDIEYAMPVIATLLRPDLRGARIEFDDHNDLEPPKHPD